jgi:hypothetical protein
MRKRRARIRVMTTIVSILGVVLALRIASAQAADINDGHAAPPPRNDAPGVHAPNDTRPDEERDYDPGSEMLERWRVEDHVERREEHREERYEAEPAEPAESGDDAAAASDAVRSEPHDLSADPEDEPALDDDQL